MVIRPAVSDCALGICSNFHPAHWVSEWLVRTGYRGCMAVLDFAVLVMVEMPLRMIVLSFRVHVLLLKTICFG